MIDEEKLQGILEGLPFSLNEKQMKFLEVFISGKGNFVLQGLAGVGKSCLLYILDAYYKEEVAILCTTGVASQNLSVSKGTVHSYLSLPLKPAQEWDYKKLSTKARGLFTTSDKVKIIVIDEVFLLNSDNLDGIYKRIERFNKKYKKRKKRDIRLLLVGDSGQSVTIASSDLKKELASRWKSHLMFKSTVWNKFNFQYCVLDEVERQEDKIYKACLDVIRYNQQYRFNNCFNWLNKRYTGDLNPDYIYLSATNKQVDAINQAAIDANPNPKFTFDAVVRGDFNIKDTLVRPNGVTLCVGLKVMTITNDEYDRYSNGSTGEITFIDNTGCYVRFKHSGKEERIEVHTWENKEYKYVTEEVDVLDEKGNVIDTVEQEVLKEEILGTLECLNVLPCAAISISKSQGLTISEDYIIDLGQDWLYTWDKMEDFGTNFLYLALSRGVDINRVHLVQPVKRCHVKVCQDSIDFWDYCKEKSLI